MCVARQAPERVDESRPSQACSFGSTLTPLVIAPWKAGIDTSLCDQAAAISFIFS